MSLETKKEQIKEIFSYYGSQSDKGTQEMVVSLLRELQEAEGCITPELKKKVIQTTGTVSYTHLTLPTNREV